MNVQETKSTTLRALSRLRRGDHARVRVIDGGRAMAQRMGMLGIRPGVDVHVVHGPDMRGAVLLVGGARIALGRGVIDCIRVEAHPAGAEAAHTREGRS